MSISLVSYKIAYTSSIHFYLIVLVILLCLQVANAQDVRDDNLENISQEGNSSPQFDALEYFRENPIRLSKATVKLLAQLPSITNSTAKQLVLLIKWNPGYELSQLRDSLMLTQEQWRILELCTTSESKTQLSKKKSGITYRARSNIQLNQQEGFKDSTFVGSPLDLFQRLSYDSDDIRANVLTNKDPGEQKLTDFVSGYLSIIATKSTSVILGDYNVEAGLGLLCWKNFGAGKGPDVLGPPVQFGSGILPYRSTIDYRFNRGIAVSQSLNLGSADMTFRGWYSRLPRTASVDSGRNIITSFDIDGQYRTETEIVKRNSAIESNIGFNTEFRSDKFVVGGSVLMLSYDKEVVSNSVSTLLGKNGILSSVYCMISSENYSILAEVMRDAQGNLGVKSGAEFKSKTFTTTLNYRLYSPQLRSPYGYNFGEFLSPNNESGIYASLLWRATSGVQLLLYTDIYRSLLPQSGMDIPTRGVDIFSELRWKISSATFLTFRYRSESKIDKMTLPPPLDTLGSQAYMLTRSVGRFEVQHTIRNILRFRTRIEASRTEFESLRPTEMGLAIFGEVNYDISERIEIGGRFGSYVTDGFASAIYQYELSAPGLFQTVAVYESGSRSFLYFKWKALDFADVWLRYSSTTRNNTSGFGSGNTTIESNNDNRIIVQIDVRL